MGTPAAVMGDRVSASCVGHQVPSPSGGPSPGPPMPFSAPLTSDLAASVLIGKKPAALAGSWGLCTPPHAGLHASDPHMAPPTQRGTVVRASTSVLIEKRPAAKTGVQCVVCLGAPGQLAGSVTSVLIGG